MPTGFVFFQFLPTLLVKTDQFLFRKASTKLKAAEHIVPKAWLHWKLSPGQTDSQVVASSGKLNLHRDLCWMVKQTGKFPHKYTQVSNKPISMQTVPIFHWLMDVPQLALTWLGWPNGEKLALTWVQIWSWPKWAQVIASQCKYAQALAKWSSKQTQVFNLSLLATPFDQGFKLLTLNQLQRKKKLDITEKCNFSVNCYLLNHLQYMVTVDKAVFCAPTSFQAVHL